MFNINLDLKELSTPILCVVLCIVSFFLGLNLASSTKEEVCKEELKLIDVQQDHITTLEVAKAEHELSCIEREQEVCRTHIEDVKRECDLLLNEVFGEIK